MSPAFKSLSYKADRSERQKEIEKSKVFEKLNSKPDPYFKSLMHQATSQKEDLKKTLLHQSTSKETEKEDLKTPKKPQKEFKSKVFGAILRYRNPNTHITKYALVQGRYTGKWSFPKGHSNKGEEPYDCVRREVYEETGINNLPDSSESLRVGFGHYYIFDVEYEYSLQPTDTNEIMNTRWVTEDELKQLALNVDASYYKRMLIELSLKNCDCDYEETPIKSE